MNRRTVLSASASIALLLAAVPQPARAGGGDASPAPAANDGVRTGPRQEVPEGAPASEPVELRGRSTPGSSYQQLPPVGPDRRRTSLGLVHVFGVDAGPDGSLRSALLAPMLGANVYVLDGVSAADLVAATSIVDRNPDALLEIPSETGNFEAEVDRAADGVLDLSTRSGGNRFSGALDLRYSGASFQRGGDRFDASDLPSRYGSGSATLGGPLVGDRAWFFASGWKLREDQTPVASPSTRERHGRSALAKLTWQVDRRWLLSATAEDGRTTDDRINASRWVAPEATAFARAATASDSVRFDAVLSSSLAWSGEVARRRDELDSGPQSGDPRTIAHTNYVSGLATANHFGRLDWSSTSHDLATDLTRFANGGKGFHEFRLGLGYSALEITRSSCWTGAAGGGRCTAGESGFRFDDTSFRGRTFPYLMWELTSAGPREDDGTRASAFVQDAWRPARGLTVQAGLRFDRVGYRLENGRATPDLRLLQPRLGVSWDPRGDGALRLGASWGRFLSPDATTLPARIRGFDEPTSRWSSCSVLLPFYLGIPIDSAAACAAFAAGAGWGYRTDDAGWDPYGWVLPPPARYAREPNRIDPGLDPSFDDELRLSLDAALGDRSSLGLSWLDRRARDLADDTCDGNLGSPPAPALCDRYVYANLPGLARVYRAFGIRFESRTLDRLDLVGAYTWSESKGNVDYGEPASQVADFSPWHFENRYGFLSGHRRHRFRLSGNVEVGRGWSVAFDGYWSSPFTWTPFEDPGDDLQIPYGTRLLEPRGSREGDDFRQLDLQVSKRLGAGRVRWLLLGSVENVLGEEQAVQVCRRASGCGAFALGDPTAWQTPRRYELGLRIEL